MIIKKLHIESFGKLNNFDLELASGFNEILQPNGWGKTTLSAFIKVMFYGMAKKGNNKAYKATRSKYKPWQSGVYGGSIEFAVGEKEYKLTRVFDDTPEGDFFELIDLKSGLKSNDFSKDIGTMLFGVGEESFSISAFFPQKSLTCCITDETRANLTGMNKFENDLNKLTEAVKIIKDRAKILRAEKPKQVDIEELKKSAREGKSLLKQLENEIEETEKNLQEIKKKQISQQERYDSLYILSKEHEEQNNKINQLEYEIITLQTELNNKLNSQLKETKTEKGGINKGIFITPIITFALIFLFSILGSFSLLPTWLSILLSMLSLLFGCGFEFFFIKKSKLKVISHGIDKDDTKQIATQIEEKNKLLSHLKSTLPTFDKEEFTQQNRLKYQLENEKSILQMKLSTLTKDIDNLFERQNILTNEIFVKEEAFSSCQRKLELLSRTEQFLEMAKNNVSVTMLQPTKKAFAKYFDIIGGEKKDKINIDINMNFTEVSPMGEKELDYLSQGYQDLIYICQRFTLIDSIFKKEKPFVLLDDPFVNLDEVKMEEMKEIMKEFSKRYQIIYLYCHSRNRI